MAFITLPPGPTRIPACVSNGQSCGSVELASSIDGPVGVACWCGWRFGTYDPESITIRDDGSSIASLTVRIEEAMTQYAHDE